MIERRAIQTEPCVALHLEDDGLTMEVTAKLAEGARHWTPEEAAAWFKTQWEDARQTLLASTVARLVTGNGNQMIRHGDVAWQVVEVPTATLPATPATVPAPTRTPTPTPVPSPVPVQPLDTGSEPSPELTYQDTVQASPEAPTDREEAERPTNPEAHILSLLIDAGKKGMTISTLKGETGLNDYQTRTAIKKLKEGRRINEKVKGRTATYTVR